jgi:hypothetical protein
MKTWLPVLVVLIPLAAVAQSGEEPKPIQEESVPYATSPEPQQVRPAQANAAPTLGHPLDPADVAVLTGKSETTVPPSLRSPYAAVSGYAPPYMYDYRSYGQWGQSWQRPGLSPFFLGRFNSRVFFGGFPHHPAFFFFRRH